MRKKKIANKNFEAPTVLKCGETEFSTASNLIYVIYIFLAIQARNAHREEETYDSVYETE